jgi:hypothetical protein
MSRFVSPVVVCSVTGYLFFESWHRHGPHTLTYGILFGLGSLVLLAMMILPEKKRDAASRREEWRKVLQAELRRWSSMSCDEVLAELRTRDVYELVTDSKQYQVEVMLLEDKPEYLHVSIAVDDGSLPASIHPESESFISRKAQTPP